jgi:alcohol dehydrogenase
MTAPEYSLVNLPDNMTFEQAGRFGYLGTSYGALKNANAGPGQVALIDGITGTLGVASTVLGLAMGLSRILGTGRDESLLKRVKALAPERIKVMKLGEGSTGEWAKSMTGGEGADFAISALGAKAPAATMLDSMKGVRRGGRVVNVGGVAEDLPIDVKWLMDEQIHIIGSNWFTTAQGQEMADMVKTGTLDLSYLEHRLFPLDSVNEAISGLKDRDGGFSNYIVTP